MTRHRLELVRGPVAEVERPRAAELERIAVAADVREVQLGGPSNRPASSTSSRRRRCRGVAPRCLEERRVAQQRHLDRLGHAGDPIALI